MIIRGRLWGALCTQYLERDNLNQEEIKRDTTVVITVFHHRTAAGLEAIELELVSVEKPARMCNSLSADAGVILPRLESRSSKFRGRNFYKGRPLALKTGPPATTLGADLQDRSQMNHDTTANNPLPSAPAAVAGRYAGSTTGPVIASALQVSWCGLVECLTGVKFWEWSKYRGDSAEFSAEV
ncbi:pyrimidine 2 [Prunus dulcis]|uniref:Pyrimidine 2 n=1 Tax=Prunus dulcis TaxID=3755 RepID=A0A4Y1RMT2_PRUDU|nr:pyrimidine 2 [Prunus dulcis]